MEELKDVPASPASRDPPLEISEPSPIVLQKIHIDADFITLKVEGNVFEFDLEDVYNKRQKKTIPGKVIYRGHKIYLSVSVDRSLFGDYYDINIEKSYIHPDIEAPPKRFQILQF